MRRGRGVGVAAGFDFFADPGRRSATNGLTGDMQPLSSLKFSSLTFTSLVNPTYICMDVPEPQYSQVMAVRRRHCERLPSIPVELTVAGSSGVGALRAQLDPEDVVRRLEQLCAATAPITAEFGAVVRFPATDIFVFSMADPIPFEALHDGLKQAGLRFEPSRFPFFPHCTLRMAGPLADAAVSELFALRMPGSFTLANLSLYQRTPEDEIHKVWTGRLAGCSPAG